MSKHYDEVFGNSKTYQKFLARWVFQIVLLSNQNTILILAVSLASIPVNILTGFYGSSSFTCFDWGLHILQLVTSLLFYLFYLSFVRVYLHIREEGEEYINGLLARSSHNSRKTIKKAVNNIQYYSCKENYKSVRASICGWLIFGILFVLLLLIPPDFFAQFVQICIANIKNVLHCLGGTNADAFYG